MHKNTPVLRRMAFLARKRSRLSAALGDAPVKLKVKSSCLLSWCGGMKVLAASTCRPGPLLSLPPRQGAMLGMAMGAEVPCGNDRPQGPVRKGTGNSTQGLSLGGTVPCMHDHEQFHGIAVG